MSAKNINLEAIKLSKEKHSLPLWTHLSALHYWVMELRLGFAHQLIASEKEGLFHFPQCNISEPPPLRRLPKKLWAKEIEVEPALFMTHSSWASSLSSSHSSNIFIFWWTVAVFQHCQRNILNIKVVKIFNIASTVKDTNTGTRVMTTLKEIS